MKIQSIRALNFKNNISQVALSANPFMPNDKDSFELSQSAKNYKEIKSLLPNGAKFSEKQLCEFAKYEGEDYKFLKGILPFADDEGEFDFDEADKNTIEKLSVIMVECPKLREIQEEMFDD